MRVKRTYKYFRLSAVLTAFAALSACEELSPVPDSELPEFVDQLVLNASFDDGNPISLEISNTAWAYDSLLPGVVDDAEIDLSVDGASVSVTYNPATRRYESTRVPKPGELYSILASKGSYSRISSTLNIPDNLENVQSGYIPDGGIDPQGNPGDLMFIEFDDPGGKDFYELHFYYFSEMAEIFVPFDFELTDETLLSPNTLKLNSGGFLFNDELFNGTRKRFTAAITSSLTRGNSDIKYLIELRKVNQDYWKYWRTLQQYRDQEDQIASGPFGNAVIIHSNVSGGLGIFMGSNLQSDTIR